MGVHMDYQQFQSIFYLLLPFNQKNNYLCQSHSMISTFTLHLNIVARIPSFEFQFHG